jgi:class 3 adenylate cyclase
VLPRRFLDHVKEGDTTIAESMRDATLIVISNEGDTAGIMDEDTLVEVDVALSGRIAELAESMGIEHFHTSTTHRLYAAGLATDGTEAGSAVEFAVGVRDICRRLAEERHVEIPFRAGLAAGNVVAGLVGTERLAFDVWGPPLRQAMTLVAVAGGGDILVDESVAGEVRSPWLAQRASELVGLNGDEIPGWRVVGDGTAG